LINLHNAIFSLYGNNIPQTYHDASKHALGYAQSPQTIWFTIMMHQMYNVEQGTTSLIGLGGTSRTLIMMKWVWFSSKQC